MGHEKSRQQFEAETPGSAILGRHLGSCVVGTLATRFHMTSGTMRLGRNITGSQRYINWSGTFQAIPLLQVNVGSSNFPAGSPQSIFCRDSSTTGSFRLALNSYKRGTCVVHWRAWGI